MIKLLGALVDPVTEIIGKVVQDKDQAAKLAHEIATMAEKQMHEQAMGQLEVNKSEAAHRSIFVAGWRPFIGWVCGLSLAYHFIFAPMLTFILVAFNVTGLHPSDLPVFDMDSLMTVLLGMLGLGGLRSFEKYKGLAK
jgi:hypothetical protein